MPETTAASKPSETPAPTIEAQEQDATTDNAAAGDVSAELAETNPERATSSSANEVCRDRSQHATTTSLTLPQFHDANGGYQAGQSQQTDVHANAKDTTQQNSDAPNSDDTQIKVDMDEGIKQESNENTDDHQATNQEMAQPEQGQADAPFDTAQQQGGFGYDQSQTSYGNIAMGYNMMNNFGNSMAAMQGSLGMPGFGPTMLGNSYMGKRSNMEEKKNRRSEYLTPAAFAGNVNPAMFNSGFDGMNGMNGMNMMGGGMMGMGGYDNGMSGMGMNMNMNMNGGPGFFPQQGGYNNFGNHMSNQFQHDRGYYQGNRPYGRGGRGRGGYYRGGRGGYGQYNQYNQYHQGQQYGQGSMHDHAQQQQHEYQGGAQDNTPQAEAPQEARGSPTYQEYRGPDEANVVSRDSRQEQSIPNDQTPDQANPPQSEAADDQDRKSPGDDIRDTSVLLPAGTNAQGELSEKNLQALRNSLNKGFVAASIEPISDEPLAINNNAQDLTKSMKDTSMTPSQMSFSAGPVHSQVHSQWGGTATQFGMQAGGTRGGYGGSRGRGGYGAAMNNAHTMPAAPVNAPTGPKALREGRPNIGFAPRGGYVPTGPARPSLETSQPPREQDDDGDRARFRERDDHDQGRDYDDRSRSRSTHRSRRHRHRSPSTEYETEEARARRKEKERERRKRKERDADLLESETASKKARSRTSSIDNNDDDTSRRSSHRRSTKDDKYRSSRRSDRDRDRSRDKHRRRRHHRSVTPAAENDKYASSSRRKSSRYHDDDVDDTDRASHRKSSRRDRDYGEDKTKDRSSRHHRSSRADDAAAATSSSRRNSDRPDPTADDDMGFKIKGSKSASRGTMPPPAAPASAAPVPDGGDPYAEERARRQKEREDRAAGLKRARGEAGGGGGARKRRIGYRYEDEIGR